jgi:hypothetical protein
MSYGLVVSNSSNNIVIDQDFRNLEIIQSGTVTGSSFAFTVNYPTTEFALAFFEVGQNEEFCFGLTTTTQARWLAQRATCRYIICAPRTNQSAGTSSGVAVFDGSSRCVFSSNLSYVKIEEATNFRGPTVIAETYNQSHAAVPFDSLVCGAYLGIHRMYCSIALLRRFKRTTTTNIEVGQNSFSNNINHLIGFSKTDYGGGGYTLGYGYPIIFGR